MRAERYPSSAFPAFGGLLISSGELLLKMLGLKEGARELLCSDRLSFYERPGMRIKIWAAADGLAKSLAEMANARISDLQRRLGNIVFAGT